MRQFSTLILGIVFCSSSAFASGWSWNLGYHNPPSADIGLNFMHLWSDWAFELGIGGIQSSSANSSTSITGDINLKYLFSGSSLRPYLQGGVGSSATVNTGNQASAGVNAGGGFVGGGIFILGNPFYFYASYNVANSGFFQFGLGYQF
jgi:hypothetical protein